LNNILSIRVTIASVVAAHGITPKVGDTYFNTTTKKRYQVTIVTGTDVTYRQLGGYNQIKFGTAINSTTDFAFTAPTSITADYFSVGDVYINTTTGYIYECIGVSSRTGIIFIRRYKPALSDLEKVTWISSSHTNSQLPTAKAVYDYVENNKWTLVRDTTSWTTISNNITDPTPTLVTCNNSFSVGDVLAFELAISGYTNRPFIVQSVLTLNNSNPDTGNIFKAEGLTTYGQGYGLMNTYTEVRHYIKFSYSNETNLMFKTVGLYGTPEEYPSASPLAIKYAKDEYDNDIKNVTSEIGSNALQVRRIWRIR
ncbi:MAG: hypothetical protein WCQ65_09685, partial [Fermentimonas sp.]